MTQDHIPSVTPPEHDAGQPYPATPRPWTVGADTADVIGANGFAVVCDYELGIEREAAEANAALIVHAVNCHDELVAALCTLHRRANRPLCRGG